MKQEDVTRTQEFNFEIDEPKPLLGSDKGPNPTDMLLAALATCIGTTFIYHSAAQGVKVTSVSLRLQGDLDLRGFSGVSENVRPGFQTIRYYYQVESDASEEKIRDLWQLAKKLSPVADTVIHGTNVELLPEFKVEEIKKSA